MARGPYVAPGTDCHLCPVLEGWVPAGLGTAQLSCNFVPIVLSPCPGEHPKDQKSLLYCSRGLLTLTEMLALQMSWSMGWGQLALPLDLGSSQTRG